MEKAILKKIEKKHLKISQLLIANDIETLNKLYGSKEKAEKELKDLEYQLNYGVD